MMDLGSTFGCSFLMSPVLCKRNISSHELDTVHLTSIFVSWNWKYVFPSYFYQDDVLIKDSKFQKKIVDDDFGLGQLGSGDFFFYFLFHLYILKSGIF